MLDGTVPDVCEVFRGDQDFVGWIDLSAVIRRAERSTVNTERRRGGTFFIALREFCVGAMISPESGNVPVPNSGPIPK